MTGLNLRSQVGGAANIEMAAGVINLAARVSEGLREIRAEIIGKNRENIMKLTAKGRYAVTAMVDLAVHQAEGPINLADVSQRQGISQPYLEQLFAKLKRSELVTSVRGPGGGYQLSRESHLINVADIVGSVDEAVDATRCAGKADCQSGSMCLTHELWADLSDQIQSFLKQIDLASLAEKNTVKSIAARQEERSAALISRSESC